MFACYVEMKLIRAHDYPKLFFYYKGNRKNLSLDKEKELIIKKRYMIRILCEEGSSLTNVAKAFRMSDARVSHIINVKR